MPALDIPGELIPGSTGYICIICEHPLIGAVETSCGHKFCTYCINLWKKHHSLCPICIHSIGTLTKLPEIDHLIESFFATANTAVRNERFSFINSRNKSTKVILGNNTSNEMKALIEQLKPSSGQDPVLISQAAGPKTITTSMDRKKELVRLLGETERFEHQLQMVYSKILTTGEKLTAREDQAVARLCGAAIGGKESPWSLSRKKFGQSGRPYTVTGEVAPKNGLLAHGFVPLGDVHPINRLGTASLTKPSKDQSEIDVLLELTDDVLRIDKFLKTFSFDTLTQSGDNIEGEGDEVNEEDDDACSIFNDESLRLATTQLMGDFDYDSIGNQNNFKVHPEVQKYLDKCTLKIIPRVPKTSKTVHGRPETPVDETIEPLLLNGRTRGVSGGTHRNVSETSLNQSRLRTRPKTSSTTTVDLNKKILQCRESLLNLKQKSEHEILPTLNFKPINYAGILEESENEESSGNIVGPLDDEDLGPICSTASSTTDLEQKFSPSDRVIRKIGREPARPSNQPRERLPQRRRPSTPNKNVQIPSVSSLPAIAGRMTNEKRTTTSIRPRPQTTVDRKKSSVEQRQ